MQRTATAEGAGLPAYCVSEVKAAARSFDIQIHGGGEVEEKCA
jgi:hypothetical protein